MDKREHILDKTHGSSCGVKSIYKGAPKIRGAILKSTSQECLLDEEDENMPGDESQDKVLKREDEDNRRGMETGEDKEDPKSWLLDEEDKRQVAESPGKHSEQEDEDKREGTKTGEYKLTGFLDKEDKSQVAESKDTGSEQENDYKRGDTKTGEDEQYPKTDNNSCENSTDQQKDRLIESCVQFENPISRKDGGSSDGDCVSSGNGKSNNDGTMTIAVQDDANVTGIAIVVTHTTKRNDCDAVEGNSNRNTVSIHDRTEQTKPEALDGPPEEGEQVAGEEEREQVAGEEEGEQVAGEEEGEQLAGEEEGSINKTKTDEQGLQDKCSEGVLDVGNQGAEAKPGIMHELVKQTESENMDGSRITLDKKEDSNVETSLGIQETDGGWTTERKSLIHMKGSESTEDTKDKDPVPAVRTVFRTQSTEDIPWERSAISSNRFSLQPVHMGTLPIPAPRAKRKRQMDATIQKLESKLKGKFPISSTVAGITEEGQTEKGKEEKHMEDFKKYLTTVFALDSEVGEVDSSTETMDMTSKGKQIPLKNLDWKDILSPQGDSTLRRNRKISPGIRKKDIQSPQNFRHVTHIDSQWNVHLKTQQETGKPGGKQTEEKPISLKPGLKKTDIGNPVSFKHIEHQGHSGKRESLE